MTKGLFFQAIFKFALGVVLPGLMLAKRILSNDKEFATSKRIREKIEKEEINKKMVA